MIKWDIYKVLTRTPGNKLLDSVADLADRLARAIELAAQIGAREGYFEALEGHDRQGVGNGTQSDTRGNPRA